MLERAEQMEASCAALSTAVKCTWADPRVDFPYIFPVELWHQCEKFLYSFADFSSNTPKDSSPVAGQILGVLSRHTLDPGFAGRFGLTP